MLLWFRTLRQKRRVSQNKVEHGNTCTFDGVDIHVPKGVLIRLKTHPEFYGSRTAGKQELGTLMELARFEHLGEGRNLYAFRSAVG